MQILSVVKELFTEVVTGVAQLLPVSLFSWILGVVSSEMVFLMGLGVVIGGIGGIFEKISCSAQKKVWENDVSKLQGELKDARNKEYKLLRSYDEKVARNIQIVEAAEKETRRVGQLLVEEEARRKTLEDVVVSMDETMKERAEEINWWTNEGGCGTPEDWGIETFLSLRGDTPSASVADYAPAGTEECTAVTEWRKYRRDAWNVRDPGSQPPPNNWWELVKILKKREKELEKKFKSSEEMRLGEEAAMAELSNEDLRKTNLLQKIHDIVEDRMLPTIRRGTGCYTVLAEGDFSEIIQDLVLIATMCERGGPGIQGDGQAAPRAAPVGTPPSRPSKRSLQRPLADRDRSDRR